MNDSASLDWDRLAGTDPYWAVLTDPRFRGPKLSESVDAAFFATGEEHVARVFAAGDAIAGVPLHPQRALDFGCGVGRLLPALARRAGSVVGADVSARMVELAEANCRRFGVGNAEVVRVDDQLVGLNGDFDFVHSVLVFQHIIPLRGEAIVARLCQRLRPGGLAVLHFTTATREGAAARALAALRDAARPLHAALNVARGRPAGEPPIRMYLYSLPRLRRIVAQQRCSPVHIAHFVDGAYDGVGVWLRRDP